MDIGLAAAAEPLEHLVPVERLALAATADVRARNSANSSSVVRHRLMHQPLAVELPAVNIQVPDQSAVL